jgi:hypothetical protein
VVRTNFSRRHSVPGKIYLREFFELCQTFIVQDRAFYVDCASASAVATFAASTASIAAD